MRCSRLVAAAMLTALAFCAGQYAAAQSPGDGTSPLDERYARLAVAFADAMLEHGRDEYGERHSPSFCATLDLRTLRMPDRAGGPTGNLYQKYFRAADYATCSNAMYDIDLYQLFGALSDVSGDARYRQAAGDAIGWTFTNTQSPATGLLAWGEHLGWDLVEDRITLGQKREDGSFAPADIHEYWGPWLHWDAAFAQSPEAAHRAALGLWRHQIHDHETGHFSRHAHWARHGTSRGYEFAREGGFYIHTWASAYKHTRDEELLTAVRCLMTAFSGWRDKKTGLIPFETNSPRVIFVLNNISFLVDCHAAAQHLPDPLKGELLTLLAELDEAFLAIEHDLSPGGEGFAKILDAETGKAGNRGMFAARDHLSADEINERYWPYGGLWGSWYGAAAYTDARHGILCYYRHRQIGEPKYAELTVAVADRYLDAEPPLDDEDEPLTPKTLAPVMAVLNGAYRLTGEQKYLDRSKHLADLALEHLFRDGVPIPHAVHLKEKYPYYASISFPDSMMLMFLELGLLRSGTDDVPEFQVTIR